MGSGDVVLTAASGDELHAEPVAGGASICLTGPPDENGVAPGVIVDAPFSVTGGTVQFEGASGAFVRSGTFGVNVVTAEGTFDVAYAGTIIYLTQHSTVRATSGPIVGSDGLLRARGDLQPGPPAITRGGP